MQPELMNALVLAYIGDAILEVKVRDYLVLDKLVAKPNDLQKQAVAYVGAKAQASFVKYAKEKQIFNEKEVDWYRRGRNAKGRARVKNMSIQTHNESTGFEAVIGTLHLLQEDGRINELFKCYCDFVEMEKEEL